MNELARRPLPHMTADEFLLGPGDGTGLRHHLIDGTIQTMSPASWAHGTIQANLALLLGNAAHRAGGTLGVVTKGAVLPALTATDNVRVPDLLLVAGHAIPAQVTVPEPVVVIEILSPGNAWVTRDNVRAYATLTSVREIMVVSTSRVEVEVYRRTADNAWPPGPEIGRSGDRVRLGSVGLDVAIEAVYARTWLAGG